MNFMIRIKQVLLFIVFFPFALSAQTSLPIIPQPVSLQLESGVFVLNNNSSISYDSNQKELKSAVHFLNNRLQEVAGFTLPVNLPTPMHIQLVIEKLPNIGEEGYMMEVTSKIIIIKANGKAGIVYGIQSLLQLLPAVLTNTRIEIPCLKITDYPRFNYRGMHLDVGRHFFGPSFIKEYIDLIAAYKMNVFHWHLVDDQGWRVEIKKYPNLTNTGAWRVDQNDKIWGNRPQAKQGEKQTYGGYYTQAQIKEIIKYAAERNVTIIPEIEMPGHVASAIASYPHLSCTQTPQLPMTGGDYNGISSSYCAGSDSVYRFLEDVLNEVVALFPSTYIHIGGDEVDKGPWKKCSKCQARMKREGLKNEEELQSYFIKHFEKYLANKKRKIIGWDEILEGGLAPDATVMSWRGESGGIEAAKMKHKVIMTPGKPVYFDQYQAGPEGEPLAIGGMNTLKNVYDYEPIPKELTADESKYVLGAQANLWTEYISSAEHIEYMILPRMPALSEVLWTPKENKNWNSFNQRLKSHFWAYEQKGLHYCSGNYTVEIKPVSKNGKLQVQLFSEIPNADIYFTTDGREPTLTSAKYTSPVGIQSSVLFKAAVSLNSRIMGAQAARQYFALHKAVALPVTYANPVSRYYMADGPNSLTDGIRGTEAIGKYWHGFSGEDLVATIDLGETKAVHKLSIGCLQKYNDWIFLPRTVKFEVSVNETDFEEVGLVINPYSINEKNMLFDFVKSFPEKAIRYIKITATNNVCPPGHSGAGKGGWIFADEIIVE